jgi:5-deoxy-glucuronate isomerase
VTELFYPAGSWSRIGPGEAGWRYLTFAVERVHGSAERESASEEVAIVLLEGVCRISCDGFDVELGPRASVFEALPWTVYLPRDARYRIEGEAQLAFASAPVSRRLEPVLQKPEEVAVEIRGAGNATRQVNNMIQPGFPAERILVVEVLTPAGSWSSYPPHKHDEDNYPKEVLLEEVYYYRARKPEGFGVQRLYSPVRGIDMTVTVRDGDLLLVPYGYHAFCAAPGYDFYYLNALAGDHHSMAYSDDPSYAWVRAAWADQPKDPRVPLVTA